MKIVVIVFLLLLGGCSTVATLAGGNNPEKFHCDENYEISRVYSGIANDLRFLRGNSVGQGIVVIDMPFSFVLDTGVLPYTIFTQNKYGNLCDKKE